MSVQKELRGPFRDSNPGPPAPEAGIIPLDQMDSVHSSGEFMVYIGFQIGSRDLMTGLTLFFLLSHVFVFTIPR